MLNNIVSNQISNILITFAVDQGTKKLEENLKYENELSKLPKDLTLYEGN